jgi:hypothetical protein
VAGAQTLIVAVMKERGYPTEGHDQTVADLSVEHASTMDRYRTAHAISERAAAGSASTEDLRQAMVDYRSLFAELLGEPASARSATTATGTNVADGDPAHAARATDPAATGQTTPATGRAERVPAADGHEPAATAVARDVPTRPDPAGPTATGETVDPAAGAPAASRPQER